MKKLLYSLIVASILITNLPSMNNTLFADEISNENLENKTENYKFQIEPKFDNAENFSDGLARVYDRESNKYGFIDKTGKLVIPYQFDDVYNFSDGLARVYNSRTQKYGFIDKTGKLVIPYDFYGALDFSYGLARVATGVEASSNKKCGYIDKTGKLVIPYKYSQAVSFVDGRASVISEDEGYLFLDTDGNEIKKDYNLLFRDDYYSEGLIAVAPLTNNNDGTIDAGKVGYMDKNFSLVIPYKLPQSFPFSDGFARVIDEETNKFGYVDKKGDLVIPYQFDWAYDFHEGIAKVYDESKRKVAYIDKTGKLITDYIFTFSTDDNEGEFSEGVAAVKIDDKYGFIDKTGKFVIPPTFLQAKEFSEGLALVYDKDKHLYGYITLDTSIDIENEEDKQVTTDDISNIGYNQVYSGLNEQTKDNLNDILNYDEINEALLSKTLCTIDVLDSTKINNDVKLKFDLDGLPIEGYLKDKLIAIKIDPNTNEIKYLGGTYNTDTMQYTTSTNNIDGQFAIIVSDKSNYKQGQFYVDENGFISNGRKSTLQVPPTIIDSVTYVPIRAVSETLGSNVDYDEETKTAIISVGDNTVSFTVDDSNEEKNRPIIKNNRMLIPLRNASETLGANVIWNEIDKSIQITK